MRKSVERKPAEEPTVTARIVTDYSDAADAIQQKAELIYIEGRAYDLFMEMVNRDEGLHKWLKGLGRFYAGANGLHMLFGTLSASKPDDELSESGEFYLFARELVKEEYQNYKARNSRSKSRFELVRI